MGLDPGPDLADRDPPRKSREPERVIGMGMGQHHQVQPLHPVLGEILDQDDGIGTPVDESKFPRTTRDQNGITLTNVEDHRPRIGEGRSGTQHQNATMPTAPSKARTPLSFGWNR